MREYWNRFVEWGYGPDREFESDSRFEGLFLVGGTGLLIFGASAYLCALAHASTLQSYKIAPVCEQPIFSEEPTCTIDDLF